MIGTFNEPFYVEMKKTTASLESQREYGRQGGSLPSLEIERQKSSIARHNVAAENKTVLI